MVPFPTFFLWCRDLYVPGGAVANTGCTRANMNFIIEGVPDSIGNRPVIDMEFRVRRFFSRSFLDNCCSVCSGPSFKSADLVHLWVGGS